MPLFKCSKCGCVDNTALANAWMFWFDTPRRQPLCTECNPDVGKWHGSFPKESSDAEWTGDDGKRYRYVIDDKRGTMPGCLETVEIKVARKRK